MSEAVATTDPVLPKPREISGRAVVIGMLLVGLAAVAVMFIYWDLHTRPFRTLTEALGREFEHSLPKVEGGRRKRGPMTLRVSLRVPFTPTELSLDEARVVEQVSQLIRQHVDLRSYERVEVHLFEMRPEHDAVQHAVILDPQTMLRAP